MKVTKVHSGNNYLLKRFCYKGQFRPFVLSGNDLPLLVAARDLWILMCSCLGNAHLLFSNSNVVHTSHGALKRKAQLVFFFFFFPILLSQDAFKLPLLIESLKSFSPASLEIYLCQIYIPSFLGSQQDAINGLLYRLTE